MPLISLMGTDEYLHEELTGEIVGASMAGLNTLRPGLKEKAYENALVTGLRIALLFNFKDAKLRWKRIIR